MHIINMKMHTLTENNFLNIGLLETDFIKRSTQHNKRHALFCFVFGKIHDPNVGGKISGRQGIISFKN